MTSIKPLERFLALSFLLHFIFFMAINFYLQGPRTPREQPLSVEFLPLPKPKEPVVPKEPKVLSDLSRRVEKETRQKEEPSSGITRQAGIPRQLGSPPSAILPQSVPAPRALENKGERLLEEPSLPKLKPPAPMPRIEEAGPAKRDVASEAKVALPRVVEKETTLEKREEQERPHIASIPGSPQAGQAPREEKRTARAAPPVSPPQLVIEPSKQKGIPHVSQLFPSQERLARLPSLKNDGTDAKVLKEETISLNTQESRYFSYMAKLKWRIENVWNYPYDAASLGQQGQLFAEFSINKQGNLEQIKLLRSSGYPILDEEALRAVRVALKSPLPLPEAWGKDRINIPATFIYSLGRWTVQ